MDYSKLFSILENIAQETDIEFYAIGGAVRDKIIGKADITDIDISVVGRFNAFVDMLSKTISPDSITMSRLKTASMKKDGLSIDIVTARKESYEKDGVLPVVKASSIDNDILRRDFSINSIAYDFHKGVYLDPLNGINDIKKGIIRGNRKGLFDEDPTRIFRLIKYSRRLGFVIDTKTEYDLNRSLKNKSLFINVSKSRIHREFEMILREENAILCLEDIGTMKLMNLIMGCNVIVKPDKFKKHALLLDNIISIFGDNHRDTLIKIADILNNGIKKSEIKNISKRMDAD